MRRVAQIMGLPISLDIPACTDEWYLTAAFGLLQQIDAEFSTYKHDSAVSCYQRGELLAADMSVEMQTVFVECLRWECATDGFFSPYYAGPYDPSGYVKGWAIQRVADFFDHCGFARYCINAGGDMLFAGDAMEPWQIGLQHPTQPGAIMGTIAAGSLAVATSGTYARGEHIADPHTQQPASALLSVTIIGPSIITADVLATTVCAMELERGLAFVDSMHGYEALCVEPGLRAHMSAGFPG